MNKSWRLVLVGGLICIVAGVGWYVANQTREKEPPDPRGYCRGQQRYISDREFIEIAVEARNSRTQRISKYANRDFDLRSPNCCRVLRDDTSQAYREIKESYQYEFPIVVVELNNETSRADVGQPGTNKDAIVMTVCGEVTDAQIALPAH